VLNDALQTCHPTRNHPSGLLKPRVWMLHQDKVKL
jgi:hypothetical protein